MGETGEELPLFMIFIIVGAVFSCVSSGCMMMFMAEENEKQTLRGLTMSPASFADIIIGKSLLTFVLTIVSFLFSRSEEHTSELQSRGHLVCRLLLEKKK